MAAKPKASCYGIRFVETSGKKQSVIGSRQSIVRQDSCEGTYASGSASVSGLEYTEQKADPDTDADSDPEERPIAALQNWGIMAPPPGFTTPA